MYFRTDEVNELKLVLNYYQSVFFSKNIEYEYSVRVGYMLSEKNEKLGKPFKDGTFFKKCINCSIRGVFRSQNIKNIHLNGITVE